MKNFEMVAKSLIIRVFATTTYPKVWGGKAGDQTKVCIYANDNAEVAKAVIAEAKKSKVEKTTFRCMGEEMTLTRYTDSHFTCRKTCRKNGKTTKISSSLYYKLLKSLKDSAEWYEVG